MAIQLFLLNPNSKRFQYGYRAIFSWYGKKYRLNPESLQSFFIHVNHHPISWLNYLHKLDAKSIIYSFGGDGTHSQLVNTVLEHCPVDVQPTIYPLHGGTMNMLPHQLHLPGSLKQVVEQTYRLSPTNIHSYPVIEVDSKPYGIRRGFVFSSGAIFRILNDYYSKKPSLKNAVRVLLKSFWEALIPSPRPSLYFESQPIGIKNPYPKDSLLDWDMEQQALAVVASTLTKLVFGFTPFGKEARHEAISVSDSAPIFSTLVYTLPPHHLLRAASKILMGDLASLLKRNHVIRFDSPEIQIHIQEGFVLDGDLFPLQQPTQVTLRWGGTIKLGTFSRTSA